MQNNNDTQPVWALSMDSASGKLSFSQYMTKSVQDLKETLVRQVEKHRNADPEGWLYGSENRSMVYTDDNGITYAEAVFAENRIDIAALAPDIAVPCRKTVTSADMELLYRAVRHMPAPDPTSTAMRNFRETYDRHCPAFLYLKDKVSLRQKNRGSICRYPLFDKAVNPGFEFMVKDNMSFQYYLYNTFDLAVKKAQELCRKESYGHILIYEKYFNTNTRQWYASNTFSVVDNELRYDRHADTELHLEFYINAGEWMNPGDPDMQS